MTKSDNRDLLIEIGTEELPPLALSNLANSFAEHIWQGLSDKGVSRSGDVLPYYSPRRLAVYIEKLETVSHSSGFEKLGPPIKAAYDKEGNPTNVALGFAKNCGVEISDLKTIKTDKGERLYCKGETPGQAVTELLPAIIEQALARLPIPKRMRWGDHVAEFVRPVHWTVVLFGKEVVDCKIMGIRSGRITYGHRFHHPDAITLKSANDYIKSLRKAKVWLNNEDHELQDEISHQVGEAATKLKGEALNSEPESELVAEVAALVEWPYILPGSFDEKFLELPRELIISVLEKQQRYFPIQDKKTGKLLPYFIAISNIESADIEQVRHGNERVIVPRLSDAMFFWVTDKAKTLESRLGKLDGIIFQKKLGSIGDKTRRVTSLAQTIAEKLDIDQKQVSRAALLSKCDLVTDLVGEFPELQGIVGRYLALNDKEPEVVAQAIEEHYRPRFAGDELPTTKTGMAIALADKLDTLAGIFGIGQAPTGEKDPFALRRAALGVVRILVEKKLSLSLSDIVNEGFENHAADIGQANKDVQTFILERARGYFLEQGYSAIEVESVLVYRPTRFDMIPRQLEAVRNYNNLPEAPSLSTANKRISNILKNLDKIPTGFDESLFVENEEKALAKEYLKLKPRLESLFKKQEFTPLLQELAVLKEPVDAFFDKVLVMTDDETLRNNRIGLLNNLRLLMNKVADLSKLAS